MTTILLLISSFTLTGVFAGNSNSKEIIRDCDLTNPNVFYSNKNLNSPCNVVEKSNQIYTTSNTRSSGSENIYFSSKGYSNENKFYSNNYLNYPCNLKKSTQVYTTSNYNDLESQNSYFRGKGNSNSGNKYFRKSNSCCSFN